MAHVIRLRSLVVMGLLLSGSAAQSAETVSYAYDSLGRLVTVANSGTVNNGVSATYGYDASGNRSNVTVNGVTLPSFAISDGTITEGGTLQFSVTKTGGGAAAVNFAAADNSAIQPSDFTASSGVLTFASSDLTKTVNVAAVSDAVAGPVETMLANLPSATGATFADGQGVGTINDND